MTIPLPSPLQYNHYLVLGAGRTGLAVHDRLTKLGKKVLLCDRKPPMTAIPIVVDELSAIMPWEYDMVIVSPGVPLTHPILVEARQRNIPILGEIELAYQLLPVPFLAVTGTNGKTTTTTLLGEILKAAHLKVEVGGNIGRPLIEIEDTDLDYVVAEVSSYQLETTLSFSPVASMLLNITPDHLGRHQDMKTYMAMKQRVFLKQRPDDFLIYHADDPLVTAVVSTAPSILVPYSATQSLPKGLFVKTGNIYLKTEQQIELLFPVSQLWSYAKHNIQNTLAAMACALFLQVPLPVIERVVHHFQGLPHRFEQLGMVRGVEWINDSKSTTPASTVAALEATAQLQRSPLLLLGGEDKQLPLETLLAAAQRYAKKVYLFGQARDRFAHFFQQAGFTNYDSFSSMENAVDRARQEAEVGEVILLSPACASFDEFANFEVRGDFFKQLFHKIRDQVETNR